MRIYIFYTHLFEFVWISCEILLFSFERNISVDERFNYIKSTNAFSFRTSFRFMKNSKCHIFRCAQVFDEYILVQL